MDLSFGTLLTVYSLYLVFVIFCFQEINNKIREAQGRFREWCDGRKDQLNDLKINWECAAWLEKDLIFHVYDFKLRIKEAKRKIEAKEAVSIDHVVVSCEKAAEDYYGYLYQCFKFKNFYKKWALGIFILLVVAEILAVSFSKYPCILFLKYIYVFLIMLSVYWMLKGPQFSFINNPIIQRKNQLKDEEKKEVNELEELVKEI